MFNKLARKGFRFVDHRVRRHEIYDGNSKKPNQPILHGYHGVYLFEECKDAQEEYYFYFGPIIEEPRLGCKSSIPGCKGVSIGCKSGRGGCFPWKGCGCGSNNSDEQFVNFVDNRNNNETVQSLNKYFGLRIAPWSLEDSYVWTTCCDRVEADSEYVKENAVAVQTQFEEDVKEIESRGFHFQCMIDLPASVGCYTSAMLFSRSSHVQVSMPLTPVEDEVAARTIHLSDFDLWYFETVYGFLGWVRYNILTRIPLIGFLFRGGEKEKGLRTSIIKKKRELEAQYDRDFNSQDLSGEGGKGRIDAILKNNYSQQLHFTTLEAYKRKHGSILGFVPRLFCGVSYECVATEKVPFISENPDK